VGSLIGEEDPLLSKAKWLGRSLAEKDPMVRLDHVTPPIKKNWIF
jgi:hypothetical protein